MSHGFSGHLSAILLALLVLQRICWCRGDIPITETDIRALKPEAKPYKRADGDGLNLKVNPDGSKLCGWLIGMKVSRNCSLVGDITAALTERPPFQHRAAMPRGELPTFFGKLDAEPLVPLAPCCLDAGRTAFSGFFRATSVPWHPPGGDEREYDPLCTLPAGESQEGNDTRL